MATGIWQPASSPNQSVAITLGLSQLTRWLLAKWSANRDQLFCRWQSYIQGNMAYVRSPLGILGFFPSGGSPWISRDIYIWMSSSCQAAHQKKHQLRGGFRVVLHFHPNKNQCIYCRKFVKTFFYSLAFITSMRLCIYEELSTKKSFNFWSNFIGK